MSAMTEAFNQHLLAFLQAAKTPFHAVQEVAGRLQAAGFEALNEADAWQLEAGRGYFTTRNDSSIIAWRMPAAGRDLVQTGWRMVGAHTDSPCLKVKPQPELHRQGYFQLGVEPYGGVLLSTWFDRDLSLAGRVSGNNSAGERVHHLLDFAAPVAYLPSLAIHLDREANNGRAINAQTHLPVVMGQRDDKPDFRELLAQMLRDQGFDVAKVRDFELSFYDTQAPALVGMQQEFIASARLDNLLSCFIGLDALLKAETTYGCMLVLNDHEEVGSMSAAGAQGPMLEQLLERITPDVTERNRALARSVMISADNAHGIHPNFADKHDDNHGPRLNAGAVIKVNANQRYATNSETSALYRQLAEEEGVPVQSFVVRSDMACGSTIGPITASEVGVRTLDIGVPQFGMHSVRELAGSEDASGLSRVLARFYATADV